MFGPMGPLTQKRPKRIMIHGLQSSGASLFAHWLAQDMDTVAIIDLHAWHRAPDLSDVAKNVVLKCTISTVIPFSEQVDAFKPDVTIFFRRDLEEVRASLSKKNYRNDSGHMDDKLLMASNMDLRRYDYVVDYDDFLNDEDGVVAKLDGLGNKEFFSYARSQADVLSFDFEHSLWCRTEWLKKWGYGNIHLPGVTTHV